MRPSLIVRLVFDCLTASLLLVAYAYDWLGNVAHEVVGTTLFMLLIAHNVFNRRWYGALSKPTKSVRVILGKMTTIALLASMLGLLATSVIISQTVFSYLPITSTFTVRQLHTLAAYVVLLVVGVHLGLQWPMISGVARQRLGRLLDNRVLRWALRGVAIVIVVRGILSLVKLNVGSKLTMKMSLEFGSIAEQDVVFVIDHVAIMIAVATLTYCAALLLKTGSVK